MKLTRGTYEGASDFAKFDRPTEEMTREHMKCLLDNILDLASPGRRGSKVLFEWLALAEENAEHEMSIVQ